jgi:uncharacterized integral membrane protein
MRLFKLLVTLVILCLIAIFVYENMKTWTQLVSFKFNYYFNENRDTASLKLYAVILISASVGFVIGLALMLKPYFRTRRMLKLERQEKKQALEQLGSRQPAAESHGEALSPSAQSDQQEGGEKEQ